MGSLLWYAIFSLVAVLGLICPMACETSVPPPGIEPKSPTWESGFLTTGPPGKSSHYWCLNVYFGFCPIESLGGHPHLTKME